MSAGLPIVATSKASEGIDIENREHAIIAEDVDEEFVEAIRFLIENPSERKRLGENARNLVESQYNWLSIGLKLDDTLRGLVKNANSNVE
jgi:glycosyltransferase involved in cell wall biosynthesis